MKTTFFGLAVFLALTQFSTTLFTLADGSEGHGLTTISSTVKDH